MKCEYCGSDGVAGEKCVKCGAPFSKEKNNPYENTLYGGPYHYNGFIVYTERHGWDPFGTVTVSFWLGRDMIESFELSNQIIKQHVGPGEDVIGFFWDMFRVTHENEVMHYQEQNSKLPKQLFVMCKENPELEKLMNMNVSELAQIAIVR